jgi:hypothetical protein
MTDTYTNFASPTNFNMTPQGFGIVQYADPDKTVVSFHKHPVLNPIASEQQGRPIYDEHDFVRIQHPGERDFIDRKVTPADQVRWRNQWAQYIAQKDQTAVGTPIDLLFPRHPGVVANIRSSGVHTVEQLSELSAYGIAAIGANGQSYVNAAQKYLEAAKRGVDHHHFNQELAARDQKIKILEDHVHELTKRLEGFTLQAAVRAPVHEPAFMQAVQPQKVEFEMPPAPAIFADDAPEPAKPKRTKL